MIEILPNWHPIFVHFTVAMLSIAAGLHVLSHFVSHEKLRAQMVLVARWNLWIGVGLTSLTVAAGWYAYYTISHDTPSHFAMTTHRNWAMVTFAVFLSIAAWEYYLQRHGKSKGWLFTGLMVIGASLLLSTAWHGGELVYRYGLGVMSMPKSEGAGHAHSHGDEPGNDHDSMSMPASDANPEIAHGHDDMLADEHPHDVMPMSSPIAADVAASAPKKAGHSHAPDTPPHKD